MLAKDRRYHGQTIRPCIAAEQGAYSHRGRWIVQVHHETGNPLAEAKAAIDRDGAVD